ncbi:EAL domain-containing protein [Cupriavidus pinatubonensis]|uniref:Cyclic di-GMP phosphodiesterase PdeF n=1 Tax=Cupriavidus pinatubonensis TaxID=248026 RepID=A0ABM8WR87_9BURK|nr:EAL domain-containing protein [Cupriavidus pinatubonensis]CAG9169957.1 Cyclic di-GMP phosphodiesterase PdeF [Cupriavidus pinatubonensis]
MRKVVAPVFMPIVEVSTGRVSHYEALARVREGNGGHVKLIEVGEEYGFVDLIDMAMMEHGFMLLREQHDLEIAVNVSVVTIEESCADVLALIFKNMDLVSRLVFEITETKQVSDLPRVMRFVNAVRVLDGRVAVDDFGEGHFTMSLVQQIRPDFLKLSGRLVADIGRTASEVTRVCDQVRRFGGEIIAEHVDSKEKFDSLGALGVRYAQGYFVGMPTPRLPAKVINQGCMTAQSSYQVM